jgi:hypothetical protein
MSVNVRLGLGWKAAGRSRGGGCLGLPVARND